MSTAYNQAKMRLLIDDTFASEMRDDYQPVYDGVVNPAVFFDRSQNPLRVLWILKEPYGGESENENGEITYFNEDPYNTSLLENIVRHQDKYWTIPTWKVILLTLDAMYTRNSHLETPCNKFENVRYTLDRLAVINIGKMPAGTRSPDSVMKNLYERDKIRNLLRAQIDMIASDIIIGGNTMKYLLEDLFKSESNEPVVKADLEKFPKGYRVDHFYSNDKLFIDAYHPSQTEWTRVEYINSIIASAFYWADNIAK